MASTSPINAQNATVREGIDPASTAPGAAATSRHAARLTCAAAIAALALGPAPALAATVPGAPTGVSAVAGNQAAFVTWTAPVSDGGQPITAYTVTAQPGGATTTVQGTWATATQLAGGTSYTFTVTASNAIGTGSSSAASGAVMPVRSAGGVLTNFAIPTAASNPGGIVTGADGALWFTETAANKIGRLTTGGAFSEFTVPTASSYPLDITVAPDGNLWFTERSGSHVARITPGGVFTEYGAFSQPEGITIGPDGRVWLTDGISSGGSIARINLDGTGLATFPLPAGSDASDIAAGPDGALWFTEQLANRIGRITTAGVITDEKSIPPGTSGISGPQPIRIVLGPDARLWFTEANTPDQVGRVDTGFNFTMFTTPSQPNWLTSGPDGALWITDYGGTVWRTTTSGGFLPVVIPAGGSGPEGIAVGPDGNLWVTMFNQDQVLRITPLLPPDPPAAPAASPGDRASNVSWTAPNDNGAAITSYTVTPQTGGGSLAPVTVTGAPPQAHATVTGLSACTSYTFDVTATNGMGTSAASTTASVQVYGPPGPPLTVSASPGQGLAQVMWSPPLSDGCNALTGYTVTSSPGGLTATAAAGATSAAVLGLTNGIPYTFTVTATNAAGAGTPSATSNSVTPLATAPGQVRNLIAAGGDGEATLKWSAPLDDGGSAITGYVVTPFLGAVAQTPVQFNTSATTQVIPGLSNGKTYTFRVAARNAVGLGPDSNPSNPVPTRPGMAQAPSSTAPASRPATQAPAGSPGRRLPSVDASPRKRTVSSQIPIATPRPETSAAASLRTASQARLVNAAIAPPRENSRATDLSKLTPLLLVVLTVLLTGAFRGCGSE